MGEKLKSPPLVEAVCEFRVVADAGRDLTISERLHEKLRAEFPNKAAVQTLQIQIQASPESPEVTTRIPRPRLVQLKRADNSAMVQVGPHLLAINHLRPYEKWETYRSMILNVLTEYWSISGPADLQRVGLRYINMLPVPSDPVRIEEILSVAPPLPAKLDRLMKSFYQRYEIIQEEPEGVLVHQTGSPLFEGKPAILLDLDFASENVNDLKEATAVERWLDKAHDRIHEAFVASLNPDHYAKLKRG